MQIQDGLQAHNIQTHDHIVEVPTIPSQIRHILSHVIDRGAMGTSYIILICSQDSVLRVVKEVGNAKFR